MSRITAIKKGISAAGAGILSGLRADASKGTGNIVLAGPQNYAAWSAAARRRLKLAEVEIAGRFVNLHDILSQRIGVPTMQNILIAARVIEDGDGPVKSS